MLEDNIVIVLDNSNYLSSFAEETPFKAKVINMYTDNDITVKSVETGKEYELYPHQILEALNIEEIRGLIDKSNYGR